MSTYILKLAGENLNPYIKGKISGIIDTLIGFPDEPYPDRQYSNGHCEIRFVATEEQYNNIMSALDKRYSGIVDYEIIFRL